MEEQMVVTETLAVDRCPPMELARAYMPLQGGFGELFSPEEALRSGTIFPCLYRPYQEMRAQNG